MQKKIKVESWEELFTLNGSKLRAMDVTVKDRRYVHSSVMSQSLSVPPGISAVNTIMNRYLLACLEKFRHGYCPGVFAREEKPKKKVRG